MSWARGYVEPAGRDRTVYFIDVSTRGSQMQFEGGCYCGKLRYQVEGEAIFPHARGDPRRGRRTTHVRVPDDRTLLFGSETIDLLAVEQLASRAQTRAIGRALAYLSRQVLPSTPSIPEALDVVEGVLEQLGPDAFDDRLPGDMAAFRRFELAATLNRLRTLRVL